MLTGLLRLSLILYIAVFRLTTRAWGARGGSNGLSGSENLVSCSDDDDDEVTLNVLRCQLTYLGQVVTSAEAWFNHSLRPRKPEGSLGTDSPGRPPRPRVTLTDTARCLNYLVLMMKWCLMSSDVIWHIRDKLWPMPKHGSIILYVHGNQKAR